MKNEIYDTKASQNRFGHRFRGNPPLEGKTFCGSDCDGIRAIAGEAIRGGFRGRDRWRQHVY
jgi:hypothetical protein